ncbi:MAG: sporulation protein YabP [Peptococcaceae bacterium]|jgi:sporulation protein YabP|nr:sporulation protein YabP [Peptococcaceae bacterium]MDH7526072.1 sporulation protein YabP [Peptococcaceae bacterium]
MENRDIPQCQLSLTNRELFEASGILEVESFDDRQIIAESKLGPLVVKGEGIHIVQLNLEEGKIVLEGEIASIQYVENKKARLKQKGKGIMERLFK